MPAAKCRERARLEDDFDRLDTEDQEAVVMLWRLGALILEAHDPWNPDATLGDVLDKRELEAIAILNHAATYLENPRRYEDVVRPELFGYLVIK